jgi:FkbM family methyltransferase
VNVEPHPWFFGRLSAARPKDVNINAAVNDTEGFATFYFVGENTGLSTLHAPTAMWHKSQGREVQAQEVPVTTLANICEQHAVNRPIHFLKVDVEGNELATLQGHDFSKWRPWIVLGEAHDAERTTTAWQAWDALLTRNSYNFCYDDGLNRFYLAVEHYDRLARAFEVPPNVYDDWIAAEHFALRQSSAKR